MAEAVKIADREIAWRRAVLVTCLSLVVPVLLATMVLLVGGSSVPRAPVIAARVWLFSVGGSLTAAGTTYGQVPLGGLLLATGWVMLVVRRFAGSTPEPGVFAAVCGGLAGVCAALLSLASGLGAGGTSFVRSAFGAFVVVGGGTALALLARQWLTGDGTAARVLRSAAVGTAVVLVVAFGVLAVQLARHVGTAADLWASLGPGLGGALVLAVLCIVALPTLTGWVTAVMLGPGARLGTATHVDLTGVDVGRLPAFPPLVAIGDPGPYPAWVIGLALVPVLAGALAGWRSVAAAAGAGGDPGATSQPDPEATSAESVARTAAVGAAAGGVAGFALGLVTALTSGAVGPGVLRTAGPPLLEPMLIAVPTMAVAGAVGSILAHYRGARARD